MSLNFVVLFLSIFVTGLLVWVLTSIYYSKSNRKLELENIQLKANATLNENILNEVKVSFAEIAQNSLKIQQEALLDEHSKDLSTRLDLFKSKDIDPINKLLKEFKESIEKYQRSHKEESLEIKKAIETAEKYAKALTTNQNDRGKFGEDWLEQILKFANLQENVHYVKQFNTGAGKPDFVIRLSNENNLIIDSKVILKNYIEFCENSDDFYKKKFIDDLKICIKDLSKRKYQEVSSLKQPEFILMYIPVEACINMIYTDSDFKTVVEEANSNNIVIVGSASLLVTLRLVNQLWANKIQKDNVQNIIAVGENLYNNIQKHVDHLEGIKKSVDNLSQVVNTEINRFTMRNNGSILKEAEKLHEYGIQNRN